MSSPRAPRIRPDAAMATDPHAPAPSLPLAERVEERVLGWGVAVERMLETETSVVAFGTRAGEPVVLKVVRREGDEWRSGEVLEAFGGRGMVRVYDHVPGAVLLERLDPGTPLAEMALAGKDDEATAILADVIGRISNPDSGLHPFVSITDWGRAFDLYLAGGDGQLPAPWPRRRGRCSRSSAHRSGG